MTFGAGGNPNTGDLEVTMAFDHHTPGRPFSVSVWEPSEEELAEIIQTKRIYLGVMGTGMMPVWMTGHDPFRPENGCYPAIVTDDRNERGEPVKRIHDPRGEESFMRWMEYIVGELNSVPFFNDLPKSPSAYVPMDTWRSFYDGGATWKETVQILQLNIQNGNIAPKMADAPEN